ncbi:MAG: hypothetical protein NUV81_01990 [bacterium]|nr:hypothetical protein [bacterium]
MNGILIAVILLILIILLGVGAHFVDRIRRLAGSEMFGLTREEVRSRWQQIEQSSKQGAMGAKLAVLEADNLLDTALKSMTMPGNTLGERLKVASARFPEIRSVWWAHKLRNQIAHDSSFHIGTRQAEKALKEFERALKKLGVM